jgi:hypothetical protein
MIESLWNICGRRRLKPDLIRITDSFNLEPTTREPHARDSFPTGPLPVATLASTGMGHLSPPIASDDVTFFALFERISVGVRR